MTIWTFQGSRDFEWNKEGFLPNKILKFVLQCVKYIRNLLKFDLRIHIYGTI